MYEPDAQAMAARERVKLRDYGLAQLRCGNEIALQLGQPLDALLSKLSLEFGNLGFEPVNLVFLAMFDGVDSLPDQVEYLL